MDGPQRPLLLYAWGYDEDDMAMVAGALTEDAALVGSGRDTVGRDAILARFARSRAAYAARGEVPRHVLTNVLVERVATDEALVRSYYLMCAQAPGGLRMHGVRRYLDRVVDTGPGAGGGWRIRTRLLAGDGTAPGDPSLGGLGAGDPAR